jgi:hypothetical protein
MQKLHNSPVAMCSGKDTRKVLIRELPSEIPLHTQVFGTHNLSPALQGKPARTPNSFSGVLKLTFGMPESQPYFDLPKVPAA